MRRSPLTRQGRRLRFLHSFVSFPLAALFAFNAAIPVFADGAVALDLPTLRAFPAGPGVLSDGPLPAGPTEARLRAAFPDRNLQRLDPDAFQAMVQAHAGQGRFLSGVELAAVLDPQAAPVMLAQASFPPHPATTTRPPPPQPTALALRMRCDSLPSLGRSRCLDSLARRDSLAPPQETRAGESSPDSQTVLGSPYAPGQERNANDATATDNDEAKGWFVNLFADLRSDGSKSGGLDAHGWAVLFFVVIGFVVVGAFLVYGVETLAEMAINRDHYPVFQEAGLRLSYSGEAWQDGAGAELYRDAYLAGLRYALGFDRPGADVGLALEGGYIDIHLRPTEGPGNAFDFRGAYFVAGPILRFGSYDPACFSLEFLNGTSNHPFIGWISKARMSLQFRMGRHQVIGADLGAVFYDLNFLDGLAWRSGNLNRDLSLIGGLDFGWEF